MAVSTREIWTEARRRLIERYMKEHPGVGLARATDIISDRHEEIGASMDAIEGSSPPRRGRSGRTGA